MENTADFEVAEDLRQSEKYGEYMTHIGWTLRQAQGKNGERIQIFVRKLGPVAIAKIQRVELQLPWEKIDKILKSEQVMMCKLEPINMIKLPAGFRKDGWPLLGTKTLRVNLRQSEKNIFDSFKKDCRYCIRQATNHKPQIIKNNFEEFYGIWKKSAKRKSLWIPGKNEYNALLESFGKEVFCITVNNMAGAVVLIHKNTAFYYYAGSTGVGTKLNLPYLVVWEAMKEAKIRKCGVWDFEGIYDDRMPNKGWRGFSHFKRSFGGREIEYPGCFTQWRLPL